MKNNMIRFWVLNFLPIFIEIIIASITYFDDWGLLDKWKSFDFTILAAIFLFGIIPLYLLFINIHYIKIKLISKIKAILLMIMIFIIRIGYMLIFHKIKYNTFIGDIPGEIYLIMIIIPTIVVIFGIGVYSFISLFVRYKEMKK